MATPQHKNPTKQDRTARAPYNFVSVAPRVIALPLDDPRNFLLVDQDIYHADRVTGWLDVTMETRSPLYIRGLLTEQEYQRKAAEEMGDTKTPHLAQVRNKPDFFQVEANQPLIPGSSLKGMIRTQVEIVTHGKLSPISPTPLIYRAVADDKYRNILMRPDQDRSLRNPLTPLMQAGYIHEENGDFFIQPAQEIDGTSFARISHKQFYSIKRHANAKKVAHPDDSTQMYKATYQVWVQTNAYDYKKVRGGFINIKRAQVTSVETSAQAGYHPAVVLESGPMNQKASEAVIYAEDTAATPIPISPELALAYLNQVTPEQERILGHQEGVLREGHPIFYLLGKKGELLFFGHTQMFRIPYRWSPQQLLSPIHRDETRQDFAEAMFGTASDDGRGQASRLFFEDARLANPLSAEETPWLQDDPLIPNVLSSPKPTTFQHYLTQDKPDSHRGQELYNYNSSPRNTTLRGHKLYWHKGNPSTKQFADQDVDEDKDKIHTRIKPLRAGLTFTFRIRFENLLPAELGALWWSIQPQAEGDFCHKLGMGKPLGLGAVKLSAQLNICHMSERYTNLFAEKAWAEPVDIAASQERLEQGIKQFEDYVLAVYRQPEGKFAQMPRIKEWLQMLRWPGPDPEATRYMEIERAASNKRGKVNEYRDRPVLPTVSKVK